MNSKNNSPREKDKPLLAILNRLVTLDAFYQTAPDEAQYYRERALLFQSLGIHSIAKFENQLAAQKEGREDVDFYNHHYDDSANITRLKQQFQSESHTFYFEKVRLLVEIDPAYLRPMNPAYLLYRAGDLAMLGLYRLTLREYDLVLACLKKESAYYAFCAMNKSYILKLLGDYPAGLPLHELRWRSNYGAFANPPQFPCPRWQGEKIDEAQGKLLVYAEQGIGDGFHYVRYAIWLKQLGYPVLVWNHSVSDDFLRYNLAQYGIPCASVGESEKIAYEVPLMSLPYWFGTTIEQVPFQDRYLTSAPEAVAKWQAKMRLDRTKLNIGVIWESRSTMKEAHRRNVGLAHFQTLFTQDAQFHCLQQAISDEDMETLKSYPNVAIYTEELASFFDTSAIIEQLDLVITVDTSVAHLSAAMGKPTWILISYNPDWRWLLEREDSIWYRAARLFRQELDYDWARVMENVCAALERLRGGFDTPKTDTAS